MVTDVEVLRLHYAETLKATGANGSRPAGRVRAIYDERFCRMWEFYLAGAEAAFKGRRLGRIPGADGEGPQRRAGDARLHH